MVPAADTAHCCAPTLNRSVFKPGSGATWLDLYGLPTTQSSDSSGGVASRAVDGNRDTEWNGASCTHTRTEDSPWWRLDLGLATQVDAVRLTRRFCHGECATRLNLGC